MKKGAETRRRIIAKAAPLFNKKGYSGCSMQDIMAATDLEKGSLYGHFHTKEELAIEAFDYAWAESSFARTHNLGEVENSIDKLKLHVENLVSSPPFPGGCPMLNTAVDADDGLPALRQRARKALQGWEALLRSIVEDGKKKGEIRADADPENIALFIISVVEGASVVSRLEKKDRALRVAQQHANSYLEYLNNR